MEIQTQGKERKRKFALWIRESTLAEVRKWYQDDNCSSQSEFVEKAILFYVGYVASKGSHDYFPKVMMSGLKSSIAESETRISRMLFKLTVELAMTMNIIAATHGISKSDLKELRATCVEDVKKTNGSYSLKDAVAMQKE